MNLGAIFTDTTTLSAKLGFDPFEDEEMDMKKTAFADASKAIVDIREYDVPYHVRVSIDKGTCIIPSMLARRTFRLKLLRYSNWKMV